MTATVDIGDFPQGPVTSDFSINVNIIVTGVGGVPVEDKTYIFSANPTTKAKYLPSYVRGAYKKGVKVEIKVKATYNIRPMNGPPTSGVINDSASAVSP